MAYTMSPTDVRQLHDALEELLPECAVSLLDTLGRIPPVYVMPHVDAVMVWPDGDEWRWHVLGVPGLRWMLNTIEATAEARREGQRSGSSDA